MNTSQELSSPMRTNNFVQTGLDLHLRTKQAKYVLKWGIINAILFAILYYDLSFKCPYSCSKWYWVEYIVTAMVALSGVACLGKYFYYIFCTVPLRGTKAQKQLLNFEDNDKSFIVEDSDEKGNLRKVENNELPVDSSMLSWHSSFNESRNLLSPNWYRKSRVSPTRQSLSPPDMQNQSYNSFTFNNSFNSNNSNNTTYVTPFRKYQSEDIIVDEKSLHKYLQENSEIEAINERREQTRQFSNRNINAFWNYCNTAAHILKTSLYQLAPTPTTSTQKSAIKEEGTFHISDSNSEVIKKISCTKLSQYVTNLRRWMSTTILERLVREIDNVNASFKNRGLIDMQIGSMGLERLRKTAENAQFCNQYVPILPLIVPFLELSSNQEYLVQRIKELAKGFCITDYSWNSGSSYLSGKWDEHLPTDSAILFHLFCVYLDSQLRPLPQGGGRPFYSRYVLKDDEKRSVKDIIAAVQNKANCAILCKNAIKPKFNFISEGEIHNCSYDRNNLFYVIIQFLIYMRAHHDSCLEGVNLGRGGINIMCVIEG